ncbi:ABC transporter permease [Compostimonas suwonensis]|uniref:ABC-2 type transport system permease protein n=1 Tax=Compostimonas suwonensis TaxID=1048394 RepID=A0A2M9C4I7_9MICO|nr:ABC transporter permease [Compostimonas suwonensis]PJJ65409.1 ABC-2 type transport system permease protein [Compostimonas suwonensis]
MTTAPRTEYRRPSLTESAWLVAQREVTVRLRSKAFLISTGILVLLVVASTVIAGVLSNSAQEPKVAVVGSASRIVDAVPGLEAVPAGTVDDAAALVRDGEVDAAVVPSNETIPGTPAPGSAASGDSALGFAVIANEEVPSGILAQLSVSPPVSLLDANTQNSGLIYLVALAFGLVFFMSAITFGSLIAQSVVEEKQTRIVEILMSTIPVRALLAGKVAGNSILAFGQIAIIAVVAIVGLMASGQAVLVGSIGPSIVWFVVFFAFGFVLLAALYAATASMVSRQEDVGNITSPVTLLVMLPYFAVIIFNNNEAVLAIMSYIPFSAPVGMPMRVFLGSAEWWEPLLSLLILIVSTLLVIAVGSRIYSNSLLKTGSRVKLGEALRG